MIRAIAEPPSSTAGRRLDMRPGNPPGDSAAVSSGFRGVVCPRSIEGEPG